MFKITRYAILLYGGHVSVTSIRNVGLLTFSIGIYRSKLRESLEQKHHTTLQGLAFYHQCYIANNVMRSVDLKVAIGYSSVCILIVIFFNCLVLVL